MNYQSHHKTEWLTLLRSWAVLLVVICHSPLIDLENEVGDLARHFNAIFSLRMPLFFFISGFLLYLTKISKKSTFKTIFNSSISRILFPYLFITIVLFLLKGLFSHLFKQETNFCNNLIIIII